VLCIGLIESAITHVRSVDERNIVLTKDLYSSPVVGVTLVGAVEDQANGQGNQYAQQGEEDLHKVHL